VPLFRVLHVHTTHYYASAIEKFATEALCLPIVRPAVRRLTTISRGAVSVTGHWTDFNDLPQILTIQVDTAGKVFTVKGQKSRSLLRTNVRML